jgi:cyclopropane-fatty-acyl-phospholipid synthase
MFEKTIKDKLLKSLRKIEFGEIHLTTPEGENFYFKANNPGLSADITLKDWRVIANLNIKGDIALAEDFRDGFWETQNLTNLIHFGLENEKVFQGYIKGSFFYTWIAKLGYLTQRNTIKQSKKNIHAHYDLGNDFYKLWLDESMTYSSAIYKNEHEPLQNAQNHKYDRILDKISNFENILEIGCGWGGFAERAIETKQCTIKGITLSRQQQSYANVRLEKYQDAAKIVIEDYRSQTGKYDAIVSIEMIEAVGKKYWSTYFKKLQSLLKPGGKIFIQSIVIEDSIFKNYAKGTDLIRTHIFPGGLLPSKQALNEQISKAKLCCTDSYAFGADYAKTLSQWLENFTEQEEKLLQLGFDKRFQRMWKFYLASCIAAFRHKKIDVVQLELSHV